MRCRFVGGGGSSCVLPTDIGSAVLMAAVEEEAMVEGVVVEGVMVEGVVVEERRVRGCGHTSSRTCY